MFEHEKSLHWKEYSTMNTKVFYIFKVMKLEIVDVVVLFPVDAFKRKGLNRMKKLMTIHTAVTVLYHNNVCLYITILLCHIKENCDKSF